MLGFDNVYRTAFIGDVHAFMGHSDFDLMRNDYIQAITPLDSYFILGDLTYDAQSTEYETIQKIANNWAAPTYCLMGNHDVANKTITVEQRTELKELFKKYFGEPNKIIKIGNVVFILVSTDGAVNETTAASGFMADDLGTYDWLENAIDQNQDKNVVVCSHQPPYNTNQWATEAKGYKYKNDTQLKNLLAQHRVDIWMYAHNHQAYKEINGVWQINLSLPYDGIAPEFKNIFPRNAHPVIVTNGSNKTTMVPCWGGNRFYGKKTIESRYMEFKEGDTSITIRARDHIKNCWQYTTGDLDFKAPLTHAISL